MANSVDPDQMPHSVASDLGLHCLQRPICTILRLVTIVISVSEKEATCWPHFMQA